MNNYKADYFLAITEIVAAVIFLFIALASCFVEVTVHPSLVFLSLSVGFRALAENTVPR